jgi:beta-glucosidase
MRKKQKFSTQAFKRVDFTALVMTLLALVLATAVTANAQAPVPDSPAIDARAHALVAKLTLDQKIELLGGVDWMYTHAMPAIDLPRFKMSDGPLGVRTWGPSTSYPDGNALAAAWNPAQARSVGEALAKDARARSVHFLLGPGVNIIRSPLSGRNFEYPSEDPFLNAALGVAYIQGLQSQGVVATVKHFAVNNQEYNRDNVSSDLDERTLREIYLPAFEAAVTRGHVDAVMDSYNLINGVHATQNDFINLKILRGEWGFQGILMSDWFSLYDSVGAANYGPDLEMPGPLFLNAEGLVGAVKSGVVKESNIDDKVFHLLRVVLRYGFLDRPQFDSSYSTYSVADRAIALEGARESMTLLKNEGSILPLDPAKVKVIAILGPDAYPAVTGGGGSSQTDAFEPVSLLTGIANVAGPAVHVLYSSGLPSESDIFQNTAWDGDIQVSNFPKPDFTGTPEISTESKIADWKGAPWKVDDPHPHSLRYTGSFKAKTAGKYLLLVAASGEDSYTVSVDGKKILEQIHLEGQVPQSVTLDLTAGQKIRLVAEYLPHAPGLRLGVGLAFESSLVSEDAKKFAAAADVVIVTAGYNPISESEGQDRNFGLPWGQDALIDAATAANPRTIVTLTGGIGTDTRRWLSKVPALLATYYPGQEGGTAVGEVLFGKQNPEGKLPATFDRTWEENPSAAWYYPVKGGDTILHVSQPGKKPLDIVTPHVKYGDGLMVGYRYWTSTGKHPLFPFGFGLSYTTFGFSNLSVPATAASGSTVSVSFDVTNTGSVAGAEVAQLYVSDPSAKATRPERELKGFEKVRLAPGETKHVTLELDARAFSYWDVTTHKWTIDPGKFVIHVGDSSENTPLSADLTLN